jgi:prolyl-tRNA synthetase
MRGREFTMKDAYSFDRDVEGMQKSYETMFNAYVKIFTRFGLKFRAVAADNGAIGGTGSHEFHVIASTGEDALVYNPNSDYAANMEAAEAPALFNQRGAASQPLTKVSTPKTTKCEDVAKLLGIGLDKTVKSIALTVENTADDGKVTRENWLLLLRGDHELNEVKVSKVPGLRDFRFATEAEILEAYGSVPGYLGPIATKAQVNIVADRTVANMADFVCGANEAEYHLTGANWGRDVPEPVVADLRNVVEGDASPDGQGVLAIERGIEVGHVFQLGTAYSNAMNCTYLDEKGQPAPMQMGCYGIGVTRILGAAIEQNFDDKGIVWPDSIAPFELVLCPMGYDRSELVKTETDRLYAELQSAGIDVIVDDRGLRPGAMFADWELVGVPHRVVIGERGLKEGNLEYQGRRDEQATAVPALEMAGFIKGKLNK